VTIPGASKLHQALYAAIEAKDADTLNSLLARHFDEVRAKFESWTKIPAAIKGDQDAVQQYAQSLIAIAQVFEAAGEPALLQRLMGPDDSNPIVRWQRLLARTHALSEAGNYADSNTLLEQILADMEGTSGTAVVNMRGPVLGRLGFNALHQQNYAAALDYMTQASEACRRAGDDEGLASYYENLVSLRAILVLDAEPERGRRLLDMRRLVARAQDLADGGRYQASIDLLHQALAVMQDHGGDELFRALLPKMYGLLGFNEYKLGDKAKAREHSALALKSSEAAGDAEGVRIYTANLDTLGSY
jgi:tetratricopeptide (TPR) repeat protein